MESFDADLYADGADQLRKERKENGFPDPTPWSDDELRDMRLEPVNEVIKALGDTGPLADAEPTTSPPEGYRFMTSSPTNPQPIPDSMEDDVGQRLAALRFEVNAMDALEVENLDDAAELLAGLKEQYQALAAVIRSFEQVVAELMDGKKQTVEGVGQLERGRDKSRRNWQHEDLLRVVLDSDRRPKGDAQDGTVETDLDVLRDVYGLQGGKSRITALRARGIDPSEYCDEEDRGWTVRIK